MENRKPNYHDIRKAPGEKKQEYNEFARDILARYVCPEALQMLEAIESKPDMFGDLEVCEKIAVPGLRPRSGIVFVSINFQDGIMKSCIELNDGLPVDCPLMCQFKLTILNNKVSFKSKQYKLNHEVKDGR